MQICMYADVLQMVSILAVLTQADQPHSKSCGGGMHPRKYLGLKADSALRELHYNRFVQRRMDAPRANSLLPLGRTFGSDICAPTGRYCAAQQAEDVGLGGFSLVAHKI